MKNILYPIQLSKMIRIFINNNPRMNNSDNIQYIFYAYYLLLFRLSYLRALKKNLDDIAQSLHKL